VKNIEHQEVLTGGHSPPIYSPRKPIHPDNVISPLFGSNPSDPKYIKQLARYNAVELTRSLGKWHRHFCNQTRACDAVGLRFQVSRYSGLLTMTICVPFQTYCRSKVCLHKRKGGDE